VYGATKAYIYHFSKALQQELQQQKNISISILCPGGMNTSPALTRFHNGSGLLSRISVLQPEEVAKIAIEQLFDKKQVIIPGKANKIYLFLKYLPSFFLNRLSQTTIRKIKLSLNSQKRPVESLDQLVAGSNVTD
jgi:short-subunit dehydrogenase